MEEFFDTYDINGNFLAVKPKSFCHNKNPNCYHKPVWIWIINEEKEILVQKRASTKKSSPNKWDMPSAGHTKAGESFIDACIRETEEELGIKTKPSDYTFLKEYIYQKNWEIAQVYLLKTNKKIENFKLQKEEVSAVKFLDYKNFIKLFYSKNFTSLTKDYKDWISKELLNYINI